MKIAYQGEPGAFSEAASRLVSADAALAVAAGLILERERTSPSSAQFEYRLIATKKTATLQKELSDAGAQGFAFVGMTVAQTAMCGTELVAIVRRLVQR